MPANAQKLVLVRCKRRRDAYAVWCVQCDAVIADACQPYWDMSKSKWMHEDGTGHRTHYLAIAQEAAC